MQSIARHRCLVSVLVILLGAQAGAQVPTLPEDFPVLVANAPDNATGFGVLRSRLVPFPKNAVPVSIVFRNGEWEQGWGSRGSIPTHWVGQNEAGENVLVTLTQTLTGKIRVMEATKEGRFNMNGNPNDFDFVVQKVDLGKMLGKMFTTLSSTDRNQRYEIRQWMSDAGGLLMFATRLHEAGYVSQANQLAAFLFEKAGKQQVLVLGLSSIVNDSYRQILEAFNESGDTAKLIQDAEALLAANQRFWNAAPALVTALEEWKAALALPADAIPDVPGLTLSPELQALYRSLTANPKGLISLAAAFSNENWLLIPPSMFQEEFQYSFLNDENGEESPDSKDLMQMAQQIHGLGAGALPLFRFMMNDPRLLAAPDPNSAMNPRHFFGNDNDKEIQIQKPMIYSDMALQIISGIFPQDSEIDEEDADSVGSALMDWHQVLAGRNRLEMARLFFEKKGDNEAPQEVLYTLLASLEASDLAMVQQLLQDSENPEYFIQMVIGYAKHRPEQGKALLQILSDSMKRLYAEELADPEHYYTSYNKRIQKALGLEPEVVAEPADLGAILDTFLIRPESNPQKMAEIITAAKTLPVEKVTELILQRVQKDQPARTQILLQLESAISSGMMDDMFGEDDDNSFVYYLNPDSKPDDIDRNDPVEENPDEYSELWLPLLDPGTSPATRSNALTVSIFLLQPYMEQDAYWLQRAGSPQDEAYLNTVIALARRVLTEENYDWLEEAPSPEKVSETRAEEIQALLNGEDVAAVQKLAATADISERMHVASLSAHGLLDANPKLWSQFNTDQKTLRFILQETPSWPAMTLGVPSLEKTLDFEGIRTLLTEAQRLANQGLTGTFSIASQDYPMGLFLMAMDFHIYPAKQPEAGGLQVFLIAPGVRHVEQIPLDAVISLMPPPDDGKSTEEADAEDFMSLFATEEKPADKADALARQVKRWLNAPVPLFGNMQIIIQFQPATDK